MNHMLQVITANSTYSVVVSKDIGDIAKKEWKEWNENVARNDHDLLEVDGMCNSCDRNERSIVVRMEQIEGIDLYKL